MVIKFSELKEKRGKKQNSAIAIFGGIIICIALFEFMKQYHLSRIANLQMKQIQNIFTNFSYNQNIPQKYKIFSDVQKSQNEKNMLSPESSR